MKCLYCMEEKDVIKIEDITPGSHLKRGRVGIGGKCLYWHHYVVIRVEKEKQKLTVVHHTKKGTKFGIVEEEIPFSDLKESKLKRLIYNVKSKKHAKDVEQRAKEQLQKYKNAEEKERRYDLLLNNCEHLAIYCLTGNKFMCVQWDKIINNGNILMVMLHKIARVLANTDKFLKHSIQLLDKTLGWGIDISSVVLSIIVATCDLIRLHRSKKRKLICGPCFKSRLAKTITSLLLTVAVAGIFYGVVFSTPVASLIPMAVGLFLTSTLISCSLYKFWKPFFRWFNSDATYEKITDLRLVSPGDILMYKYLFPFVKHHAVVVECSPSFPHETNIMWYNDNDPQQCCRKIKLTKENVYVLPSKGLNRFMLRRLLQKSQTSLGDKNKDKRVTNVGYLITRFINRKIFYAEENFWNGGSVTSLEAITDLLQQNDIKSINEDIDTLELLEIANSYKTVASSILFSCHYDENMIKELSRDHIKEILDQNGFEMKADLHKAKEIVIQNNKHAKQIEEELELEQENLNEEILKLGIDNVACKSCIFQFLEEHGICYRSNSNKKELLKLTYHLYQDKQTKISPQAYHLQRGSILSVYLNDQGWTTAFVDSEQPIKRGILKIIHYTWENYKLTRVITEETRRFDLGSFKSLKVENFGRFMYEDVFEAKEVVENAKDKIGEHGWSLEERSEHMARKCKLRETSDYFLFQEVIPIEDKSNNENDSVEEQ